MHAVPHKSTLAQSHTDARTRSPHASTQVQVQRRTAAHGVLTSRRTHSQGARAHDRIRAHAHSGTHKPATARTHALNRARTQARHAHTHTHAAAHTCRPWHTHTHAGSSGAQARNSTSTHARTYARTRGGSSTMTVAIRFAGTPFVVWGSHHPWDALALTRTAGVDGRPGARTHWPAGVRVRQERRRARHTYLDGRCDTLALTQTATTHHECLSEQGDDVRPARSQFEVPDPPHPPAPPRTLPPSQNAKGPPSPHQLPHNSAGRPACGLLTSRLPAPSLYRGNSLLLATRAPRVSLQSGGEMSRRRGSFTCIREEAALSSLWSRAGDTFSAPRCLSAMLLRAKLAPASPF